MDSGAVLFVVLFVIVVGVAFLATLSTRSPTVPMDSVAVPDSTPKAYIDRVKPLLANLSGCETSELHDGALLVRRTYTPSWRFAVAVFFFPLGLFAIKGKRTETAFIEAKIVGGRTTVSFEGELHGALAARIRRTLR